MGGESVRQGQPAAAAAPFLSSFLQFLEWRRQERAELVCGGGKVWDEAALSSLLLLTALSQRTEGGLQELKEFSVFILDHDRQWRLLVESARPTSRLFALPPGLPGGGDQEREGKQNDRERMKDRQSGINTKF